ncbi:MAG: secondary thiamine-phosphate synthase enzyme [Euryarchaeota archaeon CG01_land_8_20_14_3_00_38_12]|nr:MAG: secondary thiamine-phosphate synthase enzyme [Euryarchaeota archaeon CG01_land_8_20_14_3_00_38_12]PJB21065.1 MAG: secondary thiamine-phosphate synthase enzyme [Euryarchaeota archaeon CG_4_9_14_3_um_filter_38_12]
MNYSETISVSTKGETDIINITDDVSKIVEKSGMKNGIGCVFVPGSTGAITTIEYEPGLLQDLPKALERLFPKNIEYKHHETWHDGNGHSHVRASIIGPSLAVPIKNGKLILGTWQQIVFVELDVRKRKREIIVQIVGD